MPLHLHHDNPRPRADGLGRKLRNSGSLPATSVSCCIAVPAVQVPALQCPLLHSSTLHPHLTYTLSPFPTTPSLHRRALAPSLCLRTSATKRGQDVITRMRTTEAPSSPSLSWGQLTEGGWWRYLEPTHPGPDGASVLLHAGVTPSQLPQALAPNVPGQRAFECFRRAGEGFLVGSG